MVLVFLKRIQLHSNFYDIPSVKLQLGLSALQYRVVLIHPSFPLSQGDSEKQTTLKKKKKMKYFYSKECFATHFVILKKGAGGKKGDWTYFKQSSSEILLFSKCIPLFKRKKNPINPIEITCSEFILK